MLRPPVSRERGQAAIFTILLLTTLVGMVALVIDVGTWRETRQHMINAADAAALAGAAHLPADTSKASGLAHATAIQNGASSATVVVTTTTTPNDTIRVTVSAPGRPYFARIFGVGNFPITFTAVAVAQSATGVVGNPLVPFAVMRTDAPAFGTTFDLKVSSGTGATGNYGAVMLPAQQNGCSPPNGAAGWSGELDGTAYTPCQVNIGDTLPVKTGTVAGPLDSGLSARIGSNTQSFTDVVQADPNGGQAKIIDSSSPRLVVIPLVTDMSNGSTWPSGSSSTVRVTGFAIVFITSWGNPTGSVQGTMVQAYADWPGTVFGGGSASSGVQHVKLVQ
jgi:Flp pilus assembly protein TadG